MINDILCQQILSDEEEKSLTVYSGHPPLQAFIAISPRDIRDTSSVAKALTLTIPLGKRWNHLKRVHRLKDESSTTLLVCPLLTENVASESIQVTSSLSKQDLWNQLPSQLRSRLELNAIELCTIAVPAQHPLTSVQRESWLENTWPTRSGLILDLDKHRLYQKADRFSRETRDRLLPWLCRVSTKDSGHVALVVDMKKNLLVAEALATERSPLGHACMEVIRKTAELISLATHENIATCSPRSSVSERAKINEKKRRKTSDHRDKALEFFDPKETYLCTGLTVFATVEPCIMCTMALVHSRVEKVLFLHPNAEGGCGSKRKVFATLG